MTTKKQIKKEMIYTGIIVLILVIAGMCIHPKKTTFVDDISKESIHYYANLK